MSNEIDRLEIAVEAEANKANRALSGMEKRLGKIADGLEKVVALTTGLDKIGNLDFSGMEKFKKEMDSIFQNQKKMSKASRGPRINRSDLKYTKKTLDDIYDKFKKVGKGIDLSGMGLPELQRGLKNAESQAKRLNDRLEKKIAMEGTGELGKSWESLVYDIQKATNEAEEYREAIDKIKKEVPKLKIARGENDSPNINNSEAQRASYTSPESLNYDPDAMRMVFGEGAEELRNFNDVMNKFNASASSAGIAINEFEGSMDTEKINTYEVQIRRLKSELSTLASQGFTQYDPEYDAIARELAEVTEAQKLYNKEIRESARENLGSAQKKKELSDIGKSFKVAAKDGNILSRSLGSVKNVAKKINSAKTDIDNFRKSISNVKKTVVGAIHPLRTLRSLFSDTGKSAKGMSWGRMIGSSVLFSFVFQGISMIQRAIAEGSNNLVQYSKVYNQNISSMVSALTYLKNSWAAAFAPIVNVVAPYVQAFINMIGSALNTVGQFLAAMTGKGFTVQAKQIWQDYGASLADTAGNAQGASDGLKDTANSIKDSGNAAKKAAKDLRSYTLGIDELNVLEPPSTNNPSTGSSGGTGGSGGTGNAGGSASSVLSPSDMFTTVKVSDTAKKLAQMVKDAWVNADFTDIGRIAGEKLNGALESIPWKKIKKTAYKIGSSVATFLNGTFDTPKLYRNIGVTLGEGLNTAIYLAKGFVDKFHWKDFGTSIAESINGFFDTVEWDTLGQTISDGIKGALDSAIAFLKTADFEKIGEDVAELITNIDWGGIFKKGIELSLNATDAIFDIGYGIAKGICKGIYEAVTGKEWSSETEKAFDDALKPLKDIWRYLFKNINPVTGLVSKVKLIEETVESGGNNIREFLSKLWKKIQEIFAPVVQFFHDTFTKAYQKVKIAFQSIGTWFGEKYASVKNVFANTKDFFREKFLSAYKSIKDTFSPIGTWFQERWNSIKNVFDKDKVKNFFKSGFQDAYNAVKKIWDGASSYFKGIANDIISPIGKAVNGVISGINWVLDKTGSKKKLAKWDVPKFAGGSSGILRDTIGMVNDQKGGTYKELIVPPNGKPFIPEGRNVMLPLQKGTKIMPANQTKEFVNNVPKFKTGIGDFFGNAWKKLRDFTGDVSDYLSNPKGITQIAIDKFVDVSGWSGVYGEIAKGAVNTVFDSAVGYIKKLFDSSGGTGIEKAVKWALGIASDNSHGYDQARRTGPDYDCSSLVTTALKKAGFKVGIGTTSTMYGQLTSAGFKNVAGSVNRGNASGMKRGDVLLAPGKHTAFYIGGGKIVHASINELGRVTGGKTGDQTGKEICTRGYYNFPWTYVLRYSKFKNGIGKIIPSDFIPALADGGMPKNGQMFIAREKGPELVGRIGNRSAVAGNDQIVQSVSRGVAKALEGGNSRVEYLLTQILEYQERLLAKESTLNVDGKRMYKQLSKAHSNAGYSFSPT